jgi:oligopeptide transport system substrate-binding protein
MKEYHRVPILAVYYYGMNVKKAPFDNVKVRKAFSLAVDREEVNKILGGEKLPANTILPPGLLGHDGAAGLKFNPAEAKKLLAEAGYNETNKLPRVELGFNTNENHQRVAENIQAQLKRNLGIEIELKNEEWKTYLKSLQAKNYQMFRMGWVADFPDPDTFINLFITGGGNNHTLWGNKRYDELISLGVAEGDKEKRRQLYAEAVKIINEDEVPIIPIYYYRDQYMINERVKNYPQNVMHKFYVQFTELVK